MQCDCDFSIQVACDNEETILKKMLDLNVIYVKRIYFRDTLKRHIKLNHSSVASDSVSNFETNCDTPYNEK